MKKVKERRGSVRHSLHESSTQGSFWLINLFVAGTSFSYSYLCADLVQGLGDILVGVTVHNNAFMTGPGCTLQGFLINCGDVSSAIWSFIVALHTFTLLMGGSKLRGWAAEKTAGGKLRWIICAGVWTFVLFFGAIGPILIQNLHPEDGPYCISLII